MFLLTLEFISLSLVIIVLLIIAVAYYTLFKTRWIGKRYYDIPESWQMTFQDPATSTMEGISDLHHDIMYFIVLISVFAFWMIFITVYTYRWGSYLQPYSQFWKKYLVWHNPKVLHSTQTHNYQVEVIWTIVPSLILLIIAVPSFSLLFKMDEVTSPDMTFKAVGNQWYWTYEYTHISNVVLEVESYMSSESLLNNRFGANSHVLRLLDVTSCCALPAKVPIRVLITSTDVLHSWAVPSLGIKLDACPGRLNEVTLLIRRIGYYYGQCSEICGINHAFMPVVIAATSPKYFYGLWTPTVQKLKNPIYAEDLYWITRDRLPWDWSLFLSNYLEPALLASLYYWRHEFYEISSGDLLIEFIKDLADLYMEAYVDPLIELVNKLLGK